MERFMMRLQATLMVQMLKYLAVFKLHVFIRMEQCHVKWKFCLTSSHNHELEGTLIS